MCVPYWWCTKHAQLIMGTWPIYKKHFLQLIFTKKNFHLIKYLLATFIFVLSFQSVLVVLCDSPVVLHYLTTTSMEQSYCPKVVSRVFSHKVIRKTSLLFKSQNLCINVFYRLDVIRNIKDRNSMCWLVLSPCSAQLSSMMIRSHHMMNCNMEHPIMYWCIWRLSTEFYFKQYRNEFAFSTWT